MMKKKKRKKKKGRNLPATGAIFKVCSTILSFDFERRPENKMYRWLKKVSDIIFRPEYNSLACFSNT